MNHSLIIKEKHGDRERGGGKRMGDIMIKDREEESQEYAVVQNDLH